MKPATPDGPKALLSQIEQTGFVAHYSMLGDGNIRQYDWEQLEAKLTGREKGLWRFLLLGEALSQAEAGKLLGKSALEFLLRHRLCRRAQGKLSLGNLRLVRLWGMSFFVERGLVSAAYLGDDTKALLATLPSLAHGRCLSLYTAGGVEVMPLITGGKAEVTFADIKTSEGVLRANLELNAVQESPGEWRFSRNGAGHYDLIVSNPPCYIEAPGVRLPKYVSGGPDGLQCVRRVLEAAASELTPNGQALLTFSYCAEMDSQAMEQRLRAVLAPYGLNYLVSVSSKLLMEPGVPLFNHLVATAQARRPAQVQAVMRKTIDHLKQHNLGGVHLLKARFWKPARGRPQEQHITNYSDSYYGTWTI